MTDTISFVGFTLVATAAVFVRPPVTFSRAGFLLGEMTALGFVLLLFYLGILP